MRNEVILESDEINIAITLKVRANNAGKIILLLLILMVMIVLFFAASTIEEKDIGKMLIPIILISSAVYYFGIRYLLWNLFGKEIVLINSKSLSYQYDYGFFKTNLITKKIDQLSLRYERIRFFNQEEYGKLHFVNYNENNLPEHLFETTILVPKEKVDAIQHSIISHFRNEIPAPPTFIPFSLN